MPFARLELESIYGGWVGHFEVGGSIAHNSHIKVATFDEAIDRVKEIYAKSKPQDAKPAPPPVPDVPLIETPPMPAMIKTRKQRVKRTARRQW